MRHFLLQPEVAGGFGSRTIIDMTVHPPEVLRLHYEFDGWLGDDLVTSFPCFIVTSRLKHAIDAAGLTGCTFDSVHMSTSDQFRDLYGDRALPTFHWLKVTEPACNSDFGRTEDGRLVVTEAAVTLLRQFQLCNCDIVPY